MAAGVAQSKIKDGRVNRLETVDAARFLGRGQTWLREFRRSEKTTGINKGPKYHIIGGRVYYYKKDLSEWLAAHPQAPRVSREAKVQPAPIKGCLSAYVSEASAGNPYAPGTADNFKLLTEMLNACGYEVIRIHESKFTYPGRPMMNDEAIQIEVIKSEA